MSYILDALKKSEAELDPIAATNLALNQHRNQSRQRMTGILVAAALLANVAVLVWLFGPSKFTAPRVTVVAHLPGTPASVNDPLPEPLQTSPDEPLRKPLVEPAFAPTVRSAARIPTPLANLPKAAHKRFPDLVFSTHIYADDPSLRAVVANGKRLLEGDEIDGVAVERITQDGVILAFENYLVEIPVVANWQ